MTVKENEEMCKIIDKKCWMGPTKVSAIKLDLQQK
jgi:hypothetical protein